MTRILILGATGMLGHVLWRECNRRMEAHATVRAEQLEPPFADVLVPERTLTGVRAEAPETVARALEETRPEVAVNCVGMVKQSSEADPVALARANALFPHELAAACREREVRVIHVSTDCVFSGRRGRYTEEDLPDPADLYGRTKLAGEVGGEGTLTLRTSMIGRQVGRRDGLLEWFLAQRGGSVRGYEKAIFSGPTAPVLARAIATVAAEHPALGGLFHVGAEPISKYDLLVKLRDAFALDVDVESSAEPVLDRSLDSARFRAATGWAPPGWDEMVAELADPSEAAHEADRDVARR